MNDNVFTLVKLSVLIGVCVIGLIFLLLGVAWALGYHTEVLAFATVGAAVVGGVYMDWRAERLIDAGARNAIRSRESDDRADVAMIQALAKMQEARSSEDVRGMDALERALRYGLEAGASQGGGTPQLPDFQEGVFTEVE